MNTNAITLQDCIDLFEKKRRYTIINDGKIIGFTEDLMREASILEDGNKGRTAIGYRGGQYTVHNH